MTIKQNLSLNQMDSKISKLINIGTVIDGKNIPADKVMIQIGAVKTKPLPIVAQRAGKDNSWFKPSVGEQVLLLCPSGDINQGIVLPSLYQSQYPAPSANANTKITVYQDQSQTQYDKQKHELKIKLTQTGATSLTSLGGVDIQGNLRIAGNLIVNGNVLTLGNTYHGGGKLSVVNSETEALAFSLKRSKPSISKNKKLLDKEGWKSVPLEGIALPIEIYHTRHKMDDYTADDLQHGDLTKAEIMEIGDRPNPFSAQEFNYTPKKHFERLRDGVETYTFNSFGDPRIVLNLIDHFQANNGLKYTSNELTGIMATHRTTTEFTGWIETLIADYINTNSRINRDLPKVLTEQINKNAKLPKCDDKIDRINGKALAVHDIYAMQVTLKELKYKDNHYRGTIEYIIQDHFGLDRNDVGGLYGHFDLFRSWFLLQRYDKYNYKPFITEMTFEKEIRFCP